MYIPKTYTLHVQTRDDASGIWLCLDNGFDVIPIAQFMSEEAVKQYNEAVGIAFAKGHAMGRFGI